MKLLDLAGERRWCAWREERRGPKGIATKVPYGIGGAEWKSNDPGTWLTLAEAQAQGMGIGVALGPLFCDPNWLLAGIDYDNCMDGAIVEWAWQAICACGQGAAETSPSKGGVKQFFWVAAAQADAVAKGLFGRDDKRGGVVAKRKAAVEGEKAPGIEAYLGLRFFAVTQDWLFGEVDLGVLTPEMAEKVREAGKLIPGGSPPVAPESTMRWAEVTGDARDVVERVAEAARLRPVIAALLVDDRSVLGPKDQSDSQVAWVISGNLKDMGGWSDEDRVAVLSLHPLPALVNWREKHLAIGNFWQWELPRTLNGHDGIEPSRGESTALAPLDPKTIEGSGTEVGEDFDAWKKLLQETKQKEWRTNLNNAKIALLEAPALKGMLEFNEFSDRIVVKRRPPYERESDWNGPRDYMDRDCIQIAAWLQAEGLQVEPAKVLDASVAVAWMYRYDPVREYLETVEQAWDGMPRLNNWMTEYLGAAPSTYTSAVASMSLIGSVARVFRPGCKKDTLTLLEGNQGILKSSTLMVLYGTEYFVDHLPSDIGSKDSLMQLAGKWCVEHAEMDKLNKGEASRVKSFLSTQVDIYRRPYGRVTEAVPRRCVFWGTINPNSRGYLTDETGNRRFWPVKCADRQINLKDLRAVRDQLWAEAVRRYLQGERWWLTGMAERQQEVQVAKRFDEDVWSDKVYQFIAPLASVSIAEVLRNGLGMSDDKHTQAAKNRVARILSMSGRVRKQARRGSFKEWCYVKPGESAKRNNIIPFPVTKAD